MSSEFVINPDGQFGILKGGELVIDDNGLLAVMKDEHISLVGKNGIGACVCCPGPLLIWMIIDEDERFIQVHTTSSGFPERWILFIEEPIKAYVKEMNLIRRWPPYNVLRGPKHRHQFAC